MSIARGRARVEAVDTDAAVTPLELFFDLVFVFGAPPRSSSATAGHRGRPGRVAGQ